jgi:hypothetical protein
MSSSANAVVASLVGELNLPYEAMDLSADAALRAQPLHSRARLARAAGLTLLASWNEPAGADR